MILVNHISSIKKRYGIDLVRLNRILPLLITAPLTIPTAIWIRLLRPWRKIRFVHISSVRIGHFVFDAGYCYILRLINPKMANIEIVNSKFVVGTKKYINLYVTEPEISNKYWYSFIKRFIPVRVFYYNIYIWYKLLFPKSVEYLPPSCNYNGIGRDTLGYLEKTNKMFPFLESEDESAKIWLRKHGWKDGEPFVCLLVRDSAYLEQEIWKGHDWSYHKYRDSDINTYVKAAEWLGDQGVWVLRMGKIMGKRMETDHPKIIDYAFCEDRSDFMDVWLFAHCSLCITVSSGPDMISDMYRRPMLVINFPPIAASWTWSNALHVPKYLTWKDTGVKLTLSEYLDNSYFDSKLYSDAGISITDLSEDDILDAVKERWMRISGTWVDTDDDLMRRSRSLEICKGNSNFNEHNGWIHPEFRFGAVWLRKMGDDFLK